MSGTQSRTAQHTRERGQPCSQRETRSGSTDTPESADRLPPSCRRERADSRARGRGSAKKRKVWEHTGYTLTAKTFINQSRTFTTWTPPQMEVVVGTEEERKLFGTAEKGKQILGIYKQNSKICGIIGKDHPPSNSVGFGPQQRRARMDMGTGPGTGHGRHPAHGPSPGSSICHSAPNCTVDIWLIAEKETNGDKSSLPRC